MIRLGRDDDGSGLIALIGACWAEYPSIIFDVDAELPELYAFASYLHGRGGALWVAEAGGTVVGMAAAHPEAEEWRLSKLYVAASQRGAGLAEMLLRGAEQHAQTAGAARMMLWSDMLFTRAHAFYAKQGYVRRGGLRALNDLSHSIEAMFAKPLAGLVVEELDVAAAESAERPLASILRDCLDSGASLSMLPPAGRKKLAAYWHGITRQVGQGETRLFAAWLEGALVGTVHLRVAMPEVSAHTAEIGMLLVSPATRRRGVGLALMRAAEAAACEAGRELLTLITRTGDAGSVLYQQLGWTLAGTVPNWGQGPGGQRSAASLYYKQL